MSTPQQAATSTLTDSSSQSAHLFSPLRIREIRLPNRIVVSPMCQYSSEDGFVNDWHFVHLGSRAIGGAGLIIMEATAVQDIGRISPADVGIWKQEHVEPIARIVRFMKQYGSVPGVQLAHAGRKASTDAPWRGGHLVPPSAGGWQPVAPSPIPFNPGEPAPRELSIAEIHDIVQAFATGAQRALEAGFEVVELHGAHGYLMHQFLSPLANQRTDEYGGSFENRIRFALEVVQAVRKVWPERLPLFMRISATDWAEGGWDVEDSVRLAHAVKPLGVDVIDCSSGGMVPHASIPVQPGYQVPFSKRIREEVGMMTAAVGLITDAAQAEAIVRDGAADLVLLAREFLRNPYWPLVAARKLGVQVPIAKQYARAFQKAGK